MLNKIKDLAAIQGKKLFPHMIPRLQQLQREWDMTPEITMGIGFAIFGVIYAILAWGWDSKTDSFYGLGSSKVLLGFTAVAFFAMAVWHGWFHK